MKQCVAGSVSLTLMSGTFLLGGCEETANEPAPITPPPGQSQPGPTDQPGYGESDPYQPGGEAPGTPGARQPGQQPGGEMPGTTQP